MKLLRVGDAGREKPALMDRGGTLRDLSGAVSYTHLTLPTNREV